MRKSMSVTWKFVKRAHADQTDRAGLPYHQHLDGVCRHTNTVLHESGLIRALPMDLLESIFHASLLHDILEDTPTTTDDLRALGYDEPTIAIVELVTRRSTDGMAYQPKIEAIVASGNIGAMVVKLADSQDNSDPARLALLPEADRERLSRKYQRSMQTLRAGIAEEASGILAQVGESGKESSGDAP